MATRVSIDGVLSAPEDAKVSVFDRGFLYGDSVYEVTRTYRGVVFEEERHLARLEDSARRVGMKLPVDRSVFARELLEAYRATGAEDVYLRLVVTRGSGPLGLDAGLAQAPRRIVIAADVTEMRPPPAAYQDGVPVALVAVRRNLKSAIDPEAKTGNYLNSVLALAEAKQRGAHEALMLDHRDLLTEGASSNVFLVIDRLVLTPPVEVGILRGVTRTVVQSLAAEAGLTCLELPLDERALARADEVFITSSIREILPVVRIDERTVGSGRPGPITAQLRAGFDQYVARYVAAQGGAQSAST